MSTVATPPRITPEEFLDRPDHHHFELVNGELEEMAMSVLSSRVGMTIGNLLTTHCDAHDLGWVFGADLYYRCFPDDPAKLRKPDASFLRKDRLAEFDPDAGVCPIAPDLAVEVVSPHDMAYKLDAKVREYLRAGVLLVWVVNPDSRVVRVHRADGSASWLEEAETLGGEAIIPGFSCRVAELFPAIPRPF